MSNPPLPRTWEGEQGQMLLAVCAALVVCWLFFDSVVYATCWLLYWLWRVVDVPRFHLWAGQHINLLAETANQAPQVSLLEWLAVMDATAGILLLFLVPVAVACAVALVQHPALAFRSRRTVNIHTLPGLISRFAPSVRPVLAMGAGDDGLAPSAWALRPEAFAAHHQLVERKTLNRAAALAVFQAQLGPPISDPADWQPHEQALLAVFGAQVFLDDRDAASGLLDALNRSCLVRGWLRRRVSPVPLFRLAMPLFARVMAAPAVGGWLALHGSVRSALVGLYARDLRLPPARFRWLKGVDRPLWYGLHTADCAKVFVEGAGIVAQARAEVQAARLGLPRPGVMVTAAVDGLQADMASIGLIFPLEAAPVRVRRAPDASLLADLYALTPSPDDAD